MRGVRPSQNHRQLYIDAASAYDWDIQNFNISSMLPGQGGVVIEKAGPPAVPVENKKLKFLQLNCNGFRSSDPNVGGSKFCVNVRKHSGLYFKQLHAEGNEKSIIVEDIELATNDEPIIFEHSGLAGEFNDDSMKLYLVSNGVLAAPDVQTAQQQNHPDKARLEFSGAGLQSTVVDCGDLHGDRTDTFVRENPNDPVGWDDWRMLFTHTERNRESFFAKHPVENRYYPKSHTVCPAGVPGFPNINEIGGENFNTGVMPMETFLPYSNSFGPCSDPPENPGYCAGELQAKLNSNTNGGTVQINGLVKVDRTITIPSGRQIVGGQNAELILSLMNEPFIPTDLLQINTLADASRVSGITIRNLKLGTNRRTTAGIAIVGADHTQITGVSSDMHFSGLIIEGFGKGLDVRTFGPLTKHQMVDGVSWKNIKFVNNQIAASVFPSNVSNWNIINLSMESNSPGAVGWYQANTGNSTQNVTCQGTETNVMEHCIKLVMAGIYLTGLKQTEHVENDLTFGLNGYVGGEQSQYYAPQFSYSVLRNNDFTGKGSVLGAVNFIGKTFITSMNNRYKNFKVGQGTPYQGEFSRVTYCGDIFESGTAFPGLAELHNNLYVGVHTPTRIQCGNASSVPGPKPWEDVINWGHESNEAHYRPDQPLVGNFEDNYQEDLVIYREGAPSTFRIKTIDGKKEQTIPWGTQHDIPLIGRFFPDSRAQIVIFRPSTGQWWVKDPKTSATYVWQWGINGDIPFIGNFLDESGSVNGHMDEIAVYRPNTKEIWILNPRSNLPPVQIQRYVDYGSKIQVGDFWGAGYDQIAQYKYENNNGVWTLLNVRTNATGTASISNSQEADVPVAGKYFSGTCMQIAVWRPGTEEFIVKDPPFANCGSRLEQSIKWGSNNDYLAGEIKEATDCSISSGQTLCPDDIPLRINDATSLKHRPTAYRRTNGVYTYSKAKGQWWIHDPFPF